MPYKVCPSCQQASYSANISGIWFCPYCGKELTLSKSIQDRRKLPSEHDNQGLSQPLGKLHIFPQK